ncbi:NAD(P)(+)--arginine ADP-ribosyltransferase 2-like protein [Labeo rohita]|uniref:NAD(P)(+)--arginine ADP-ribosyltransferase n=1 Tax=Labeo rohita TaxID=84645 RepID=A0A498NFJ2_LABRO|nr:NAD(P)(+)--arginine ADP-ribosyltransferase 2-like protein [Labeo rohita]
MLLMIEALLSISAAVGKDPRSDAADGQIFSLDMAEDSVDDLYVGCKTNMADQNFDNAVRTDKKKYQDKTFPWYSLFFFLTEAIQILKEMQNGCRLTYRGTNVEFNGNVLNTEVRFGQFALSSLDRTKAEKFGTTSCFEIRTCEGVELANYSRFPYEKDVLIPPYEKFSVTEVKKRTDHADLWCETVYILESTGAIIHGLCELQALSWQEAEEVFLRGPTYHPSEVEEFDRVIAKRMRKEATFASQKGQVLKQVGTSGGESAELRSAVKMVFVKEEHDEYTSEPEPLRIKHEEQGGYECSQHVNVNKDMPRKERRKKQIQKELCEAAKGSGSLTSWITKSTDKQQVKGNSSDEEMEGESEAKRQSYNLGQDMKSILFLAGPSKTYPVLFLFSD